jgi:glycosyltransferase involved in cell wall biosynthesis
VVAIEKLIPLVYRRMPFLAVSESSKQDLVERGVPAERIDLLYNGITLPQIEIRPVTQRPCRVAYLGRLEPYKRIGLLLGAVAELAKRLPRLELVLVGRGSERDALERLAAELGIAERTRFAGFVSDEERDALVAEARVCVSPSVKEGWGITVIEANALGVPVVATDAPGLRDAVRHDETGLLVADAAAEVFTERLAAAVERLLTDEAMLTRLSNEALAWSRRFDWDSSAQRMAEVIERTRWRSTA